MALLIGLLLSEMSFHTFTRTGARRLRKIKLPPSAPVGEPERIGKMIEKLAARNVFGAKGLNVARWLLAIEDPKAPGLQLTHERDQRDFRGVRHAREHRFAEKDTAECHAVEPPNQSPLPPGFYGVGVPEFMKLHIGFHHLGRDPGSTFGVLRPWSRAPVHHITKPGVERDGKPAESNRSL